MPYAGDSSRNGFDVWIDPTPLPSEEDQAAGKLSDNAQKFTISYDAKADGFYWNNTEISADLIAKVRDGKVRVKFVANDSTRTAISGIYGVRTTTSTEYSADASLKGLAFDTGDLCDKTGSTLKEFSSDSTSYVLKVPAGTESVRATITGRGDGGYVMVDDVVVKDGSENPREITLDGDSTTVTFASYAQDHKTVKYYTVIIVKDGASVPEASEPVAEYRFDNDKNASSGASLTNTGSLGNKADGLVVNGGATLSDDDGGKTLSLTGGSASSTSPYVKIPAGVIADGQKDLTVSVKMKWNGNDSCVYPFNIGKDKKNYLSYIVSCGSNTRMESKVNDSTVAAARGDTPAKGVWVTATAVLRGGKSLSYYLDGKLVAKTSTTLTAGQVKGADDFTGYLGKSFYSDPYFGGEIDDFRIWDRAVSAGELFQEPDPEPEPPAKSADATLKSLTVAGQAVDLEVSASEAGAKVTVAAPAAVTVKDVVAVKNDDKAADPKIELKDGIITVTVTAEDGIATKTYKVELEQAVVPVESVTIDGDGVADGTLAMKVGTTVELTATVIPDGATDKAVTWTSSNPTVATVDNGVVSALAEGKVAITAAAGGKSASVTVIVTKDEVAPQPASDEEFGELEKAIKSETDANLNRKDYTADSWDAYQTALGNAKDVLDNRQSTSEQVRVAIDALAAAKRGLVKSGGGEQPKPGESGKPSGGETGKGGNAAGNQNGRPGPDKKNGLVSTGASVAGAALFVTSLLGFGIALAACRKRLS